MVRYIFNIVDRSIPKDMYMFFGDYGYRAFSFVDGVKKAEFASAVIHTHKRKVYVMKNMGKYF